MIVFSSVRSFHESRQQFREYTQEMTAVHANKRRKHSFAPLKMSQLQALVHNEQSYNNCTPMDYTWFDFAKLLIDQNITEEDLVAGTARLIPAFCRETPGIFATISLGGAEECHYSSDNNTNFAMGMMQSMSRIQSVAIPDASTKDSSDVGSIHIFQQQQQQQPGLQRLSMQSSRSDSLDSGTTPESSRSHPTRMAREGAFRTRNESSCPFANSASPNEASNEEKSTNEKPPPPKGRIEMLAQLLGQALSRRRNQEEQIRFFEDSNDLHAVLEEISNDDETTELKVAQTNPAWMHALGWSREELVGKSLNDFVHPEDVSRIKSFSEQSPESSDDEASKETAESSEMNDFGNPDLPFANKYCFEIRVRATDGSYHWISWSVAGTSSSRTLGGSNKQLQQRRILVTGRDYTARKQAETALWESQRRLRESQNIAHIGQWELDLQQNDLYWSGMCIEEKD